jgi:hypothetical protein
LVPASHRNYFFKSPLYMAFPTAADPADRAVGPLSPLPCQAWHGYGVSNALHGEVTGYRRACKRTPLRGRRRAPHLFQLFRPDLTQHSFEEEVYHLITRLGSGSEIHSPTPATTTLNRWATREDLLTALRNTFYTLRTLLRPPPQITPLSHLSLAIPRRYSLLIQRQQRPTYLARNQHRQP